MKQEGVRAERRWKKKKTWRWLVGSDLFQALCIPFKSVEEYILQNPRKKLQIQHNNSVRTVSCERT
jgi:hypothetical protein